MQKRPAEAVMDTCLRVHFAGSGIDGWFIERKVDVVLWLVTTITDATAFSQSGAPGWVNIIWVFPRFASGFWVAFWLVLSCRLSPSLCVKDRPHKTRVVRSIFVKLGSSSYFTLCLISAVH